MYNVYYTLSRRRRRLLVDVVVDDGGGGGGASGRSGSGGGGGGGGGNRTPCIRDRTAAADLSIERRPPSQRADPLYNPLARLDL